MLLTSIGNPIVELRRSYDRLISTMGFPTLVRWHLYIESGSGPYTIIWWISVWIYLGPKPNGWHGADMFSNTFSCMEIVRFWFIFHRNRFPGFLLTIYRCWWYTFKAKYSLYKIDDYIYDYLLNLFFLPVEHQEVINYNDPGAQLNKFSAPATMHCIRDGICASKQSVYALWGVQWLETWARHI